MQTLLVYLLTKIFFFHSCSILRMQNSRPLGTIYKAALKSHALAPNHVSMKCAFYVMNKKSSSTMQNNNSIEVYNDSH